MTWHDFYLIKRALEEENIRMKKKTYRDGKRNVYYKIIEKKRTGKES